MVPQATGDPLVTAQVPITALSVYSSLIPAQSAVETTSNRPPTTGFRRQTGDGGCLSGDLPAFFC